jgi:hypothetical protein
VTHIQDRAAKRESVEPDVDRGADLIIGAIVFGVCVVAGSVIGYWLALPDELNNENATPPPEGIGLFFGLILGAAIGSMLTTAFARDAGFAFKAATWAFAVLALPVGLFVVASTGGGSVLAILVFAVLVAYVAVLVGAFPGLALGELINLVASAARRRRDASARESA